MMVRWVINWSDELSSDENWRDRFSSNHYPRDHFPSNHFPRDHYRRDQYLYAGLHNFFPCTKAAS